MMIQVIPDLIKVCHLLGNLWHRVQQTDTQTIIKFALFSTMSFQTGMIIQENKSCIHVNIITDKKMFKRTVKKRYGASINTTK